MGWIYGSSQVPDGALIDAYAIALSGSFSPEPQKGRNGTSSLRRA
jgi:hypothetical protein